MDPFTVGFWAISMGVFFLVGHKVGGVRARGRQLSELQEVKLLPPSPDERDPLSEAFRTGMRQSEFEEMFLQSSLRYFEVEGPVRIERSGKDVTYLSGKSVVSWRMAESKYKRATGKDLLDDFRKKIEQEMAYEDGRRVGAEMAKISAPTRKADRA